MSGGAIECAVAESPEDAIVKIVVRANCCVLSPACLFPLKAVIEAMSVPQLSLFLFWCSLDHSAFSTAVSDCLLLRFLYVSNTEECMFMCLFVQNIHTLAFN